MRSRAPLTPGVAAGVAAVVLVLGGCTSDPASDPVAESSPSSPATPAAPATPSASPEPEVTIRAVPAPPPLGACYRMGLTSATRPTNASQPVPCTGPHTAQTVHVGRLDLTPGERRLRLDAPAVQQQPARTCPARLRQYVGGTTDTLRRSRLEVVWFTPTLGQAERGARWFRCDAVAVADDDRLLRLPLGPRLRGLLDRPGALTTYGLCGTAQPGTPGFRRVACALPHRWEAVSTIDLAGGARYPGTARVRAAGEETCADQVGGRSGLVLEFRYGWEWPTRAQWAAGQRHGYCWAPSRPS